MKKTISKLLVLTMAVMLLSSMLLSVSALEDYATLSDGLSSEAMAGNESIVEFTAADNAGVFGLRISKGMDVYVVACFLVIPYVKKTYFSKKKKTEVKRHA